MAKNGCPSRLHDPASWRRGRFHTTYLTLCTGPGTALNTSTTTKTPPDSSVDGEIIADFILAEHRRPRPRDPPLIHFF